MSKGICYWCGEPIENKSFRRYIGLDEEGKNVHQYFCDEVCIECFECDTGIENELGSADKINTVKIVKNGYKAKRCSTCGRGGKAKDFSCKISVNANRGNNSGKKLYCCDKGCLQTLIKEIADGEVEI